jgi:hypothetical protein
MIYHKNSFDCTILEKKQKVAARKAVRNWRKNQLAKKFLKPRFDDLTTASNSEPVVLLPTSEIEKNPRDSSCSVLSPSLTKLKHPIDRIPGVQKLQPVIGSPIPTTQHLPEIVDELNYVPAQWNGVELGVGGIMSMLLLTFLKSRAQRLSYWAKENKWKARLILVAAKIGTAIVCLHAGRDLLSSGMVVPEHVRLIGAGIFASAASFYPIRNSIGGSSNYLSRKLHDAALFTSGALLMIYAGNHYDVKIQQQEFINAESHVSVKSSESVFSFAHETIQVVKTKVKAPLQEPKKERSKTDKIILTCLVILGFMALTFGLGALACNISCGGSEAIAVAVFIAGSGVIIWGLIASIRAIHRPRRSKIPPVQTAS